MLQGFGPSLGLDSDQHEPPPVVLGDHRKSLPPRNPPFPPLACCRTPSRMRAGRHTAVLPTVVGDALAKRSGRRRPAIRDLSVSGGPIVTGGRRHQRGNQSLCLVGWGSGCRLQWGMPGPCKAVVSPRQISRKTSPQFLGSGVRPGTGLGTWHTAAGWARDGIQCAIRLLTAPGVSWRAARPNMWAEVLLDDRLLRATAVGVGSASG
jgi:hypothetical protein